MTDKQKQLTVLTDVYATLADNEQASFNAYRFLLDKLITKELNQLDSEKSAIEGIIRENDQLRVMFRENLLSLKDELQRQEKRFQNVTESID